MYHKQETNIFRVFLFYNPVNGITDYIILIKNTVLYDNQSMILEDM